MQDLKAFTSHAPFFQENFRGYALLQQRDKKKKRRRPDMYETGDPPQKRRERIPRKTV